MQEEWRPVDGYEDYLISNFGRVKSFQNGKEKILKPTLNEHGYFRVTLCKNGNKKTIKVHRLVATAFIDNPNGLPQVNHKDGNKENNSVENLEWVTASQNVKHAIDTGLLVPVLVKGERHGGHKLTQDEVNEIRRLYVKGSPKFGSTALSKKYGANNTTILRIVKNKAWKSEIDNNLN